MTGPTAPQTAVDAARWDELERLAREATPGPWGFEVSHSDPEGDYAVGVHGPERGQWVVRFDDDTGTNQWADGVYIAATSPDVVLGLIAELRLAIAHDRQPYPTAWAYEQVCRVRDEQAAELDRLRAIRAESSAETERLRAFAEHMARVNPTSESSRAFAVVMDYQKRAIRALAPADAAGGREARGE